VVFSFFWASPTKSLSGLSPTEFMSIFYCLYFLRLLQTGSRSHFTTDGRSVSLHILVSGTPLRPMTIFFFFHSFTRQLLCSPSLGALSDERIGL
jgi:hypothetical protein